MIKDYQIVAETSVEALTNKVRALIARGWQPYGSMTIALTDGLLVYFQPICHDKFQR